MAIKLVLKCKKFIIKGNIVYMKSQLNAYVF